MHHIHTDIILLAVAVEGVARAHHLTEGQLKTHLQTLRPEANPVLLSGAATLALGSEAAIGQLFSGRQAPAGGEAGL